MKSPSSASALVTSTEVDVGISVKLTTTSVSGMNWIPVHSLRMSGFEESALSVEAKHTS